MKQDFSEQLDTLTREAQLEILRICTEQKQITVFTATGKEESDEEWSVDIYDDVPDFPYYEKHGGIEYAAVKELRWDGTNVYITGLLKSDSYPETATVSLLELDAPSSCALADYLISMKLPQNS